MRVAIDGIQAGLISLVTDLDSLAGLKVNERMVPIIGGTL
jgi:hypothetical protein